MALKLYWYFYLLMEKPLGRYFQVRSPYYQAAQCNQKTPIPVFSRWQVRSEKAEKGQAPTLITATTVWTPTQYFSILVEKSKKSIKLSTKHGNSKNFHTLWNLLGILLFPSQIFLKEVFLSGSKFFTLTKNLNTALLLLKWNKTCYRVFITFVMLLNTSLEEYSLFQVAQVHISKSTKANLLSVPQGDLF